MSSRGKSAAAENDFFGRRILGWIALGQKLLCIRACFWLIAVDYDGPFLKPAASRG